MILEIPHSLKTFTKQQTSFNKRIVKCGALSDSEKRMINKKGRNRQEKLIQSSEFIALLKSLQTVEKCKFLKQK
jgi:hypothetical protein